MSDEGGVIAVSKDNNRGQKTKFQGSDGFL